MKETFVRVNLMARATTIRAVSIALVSTLFFSTTFVLNRRLVTSQGANAWLWGVILRYLFTVVLLAPLVLPSKEFPTLRREIRLHWGEWLKWSFIGFGVFGTCLTWAASSGPSWLIAGGWQTTVIAGPIVGVFFYRGRHRSFDLETFSYGLMILAGVLLMQFSEARHSVVGVSLLLPLGAVLVAAFAYPLGNRMLLLSLEARTYTISTLHRVFGMTLASLFLWIPLSIVAWVIEGLPTFQEILLAGGVALFSGVVGTTLFFSATKMVHDDKLALSIVESMQCGEVIFSMLLGTMLLGEAWPQGKGAVGVAFIVLGIILISLKQTPSETTSLLNREN